MEFDKKISSFPTSATTLPKPSHFSRSLFPRAFHPSLQYPLPDNPSALILYQGLSTDEASPSTLSPRLPRSMYAVWKASFHCSSKGNSWPLIRMGEQRSRILSGAPIITSRERKSRGSSSSCTDSYSPPEGRKEKEKRGGWKGGEVFFFSC